MNEKFPIEQPSSAPESEVTVVEVREILQNFTPEAIRAAADLIDQLPHMHEVNGELTPKHTLEERISLVLS